MFHKLKSKFKKKKDSHKSARIREERKHILTNKSDFFIRESYKTLRTNVSFSLTGYEESKIICVTSSLQSEGKSITATNLAISYAQTGSKVIIVDCDLRRPKLARLLQLNNSVGLSNLIMKPELRQKAIVASGIENLDVILSGDIPPNPSELLSSQRMQDLLAALREEYDYIILDTPPINVVIDAVVLSPLCDGVLFVVRASISERGAIIDAVEQLEYAKAKILGFVLNGVGSEGGSYGYGRYRYKRYGKYGFGNGYSPLNYGYGYGYGRGYSYRGYGRGYGYGYGYGYGHQPAQPQDTANHPENHNTI